MKAPDGKCFGTYHPETSPVWSGPNGEWVEDVWNSDLYSESSRLGRAVELFLKSELGEPYRKPRPPKGIRCFKWEKGGDWNVWRERDGENTSFCHGPNRSNWSLGGGSEATELLEGNTGAYEVFDEEALEVYESYLAAGGKLP